MATSTTITMHQQQRPRSQKPSSQRNSRKVHTNGATQNGTANSNSNSNNSSSIKAPPTRKKSGGVSKSIKNFQPQPQHQKQEQQRRAPASLPLSPPKRGHHASAEVNTGQAPASPPTPASPSSPQQQQQQQGNSHSKQQRQPSMSHDSLFQSPTGISNFVGNVIANDDRWASLVFKDNLDMSDANFMMSPTQLMEPSDHQEEEEDNIHQENAKQVMAIPMIQEEEDDIDIEDDNDSYASDSSSEIEVFCKTSHAMETYVTGTNDPLGASSHQRRQQPAAKQANKQQQHHQQQQPRKPQDIRERLLNQDIDWITAPAHNATQQILIQHAMVIMTEQKSQAPRRDEIKGEETQKQDQQQQQQPEQAQPAQAQPVTVFSQIESRRRASMQENCVRNYKSSYANANKNNTTTTTTDPQNTDDIYDIDIDIQPVYSQEEEEETEVTEVEVVVEIEDDEEIVEEVVQEEDDGLPLPPPPPTSAETEAAGIDSLQQLVKQRESQRNMGIESPLSPSRPKKTLANEQKQGEPQPPTTTQSEPTKSAPMQPQSKAPQHQPPAPPQQPMPSRQARRSSLHKSSVAPLLSMFGPNTAKTAKPTPTPKNNHKSSMTAKTPPTQAPIADNQEKRTVVEVTSKVPPTEEPSRRDLLVRRASLTHEMEMCDEILDIQDKIKEREQEQHKLQQQQQSEQEHNHPSSNAESTSIGVSGLGNDNDKNNSTADDKDDNEPKTASAADATNVITEQDGDRRALLQRRASLREQIQICDEILSLKDLIAQQQQQQNEDGGTGIRKPQLTASSTYRMVEMKPRALSADGRQRSRTPRRAATRGGDGAASSDGEQQMGEETANQGDGTARRQRSRTPKRAVSRAGVKADKKADHDTTTSQIESPKKEIAAKAGPAETKTSNGVRRSRGPGQNRKRSSEIKKDAVARASALQAQKQQRQPPKNASSSNRASSGRPAARTNRAETGALSDEDTVVATNQSKLQPQTGSVDALGPNQGDVGEKKPKGSKQTRAANEARPGGGRQPSHRREMILTPDLIIDVESGGTKRRELDLSADALAPRGADEDEDDASVHSTHSAAAVKSRKKKKKKGTVAPASSFVSSSLLLANSQRAEHRRGSITMDTLLPNNLKGTSAKQENPEHPELVVSTKEVSTKEVTGLQNEPKRNPPTRKKSGIKNRQPSSNGKDTKTKHAGKGLPLSPTRSQSARSLKKQGPEASINGKSLDSRKKAEPTQNRRASLTKHMSVPVLKTVLESEENGKKKKKKVATDARSLDGGSEAVPKSNPRRRKPTKPQSRLDAKLKQTGPSSSEKSQDSRSLDGSIVKAPRARMRRVIQDPPKKSESTQVSEPQSGQSSDSQPQQKAENADTKSHGRNQSLPRRSKSKHGASLTTVLENQQSKRTAPLETRSLDGEEPRSTPRKGTKKELRDVLESEDYNETRASQETRSLDGEMVKSKSYRKSRRNKAKISRAESEAMPSLLGETKQQKARAEKAKDVHARRSTMDYLLHDESQATINFSLQDEEKKKMIIPGNLSAI